MCCSEFGGSVFESYFIFRIQLHTQLLPGQLSVILLSYPIRHKKCNKFFLLQVGGTLILILTLFVWECTCVLLWHVCRCTFDVQYHPRVRESFFARVTCV